jgi:hypothetical protein
VNAPDYLSFYAQAFQRGALALDRLAEEAT